MSQLPSYLRQIVSNQVAPGITRRVMGGFVCRVFALVGPRITIVAGMLLLIVFAYAVGSVNAEDPLDDRYQADVVLDVLDRATIHSRVEGFIDKLPKKPGEMIGEGDVLVELDTRMISKRLAVKKSEYLGLQARSNNRARQETSQARETAAQEHVVKLHEVVRQHGLQVPKLEMVRADMALEAAAAETRGASLEALQAKYEAEAKCKEIELLEFQLKNSRIVSPFEGVVSNKFGGVGEVVRTGTPILEVLRMDKLQGVLLVDSATLSPGDIVNKTALIYFEPDTQTGSHAKTHAIEVTIQRLFPQIDVDGHYRVFVEIPNRRSQHGQWSLLPGMIGRAEINLAKK